jgi:tight adherence protein B
MPEISEIHVFYAFLAVTAILIIEAIYLVVTAGEKDKKRINRRMRIGGKQANQQDILLQLRKERGLTAGGQNSMKFTWLNELITQSGLSMGVSKPVFIAIAIGFCSGLAVLVLRHSPLEALVATIAGSTLIPILILMYLRARRRKQFGEQLPEAIELIVRSLKAGHPVPVAFSVVSKEMSDPIGSEFGFVSDEVTYGADFVTALRKMQTRVGQEDLPLFLTAVAIQSSTGGNLREILDGLAEVIRSRIKMRRKIKAISAEGRMSAIFLTCLPIVLFMIINFVSPEFYGDIWHETNTMYGLGLAGFWLFVGNAMMAKMVNFKF